MSFSLLLLFSPTYSQPSPDLIRLQVVIGGATTDLQPGDVQVMDGGAAGQVVAVKKASFDAAAAPAKGEFSNRITGQTDAVLAILVDWTEIGEKARVKLRRQILRGLQHLRPGTRASIYSLSSSTLQVFEDCTGKGAATGGFEQALGGRPIPWKAVEYARTPGAAETLDFIAQHLTQFHGPKSIVWIAGTFAYESTLERAATKQEGSGFRGALRDSGNDAERTYNVYYSTAPANADGAWHPVKVRFGQRGATPRHSVGYWAVPRHPQDRAGRERELRTAADSPVDSTELLLDARLHREASSALTIELRVEPDPGGKRWNILFASTSADGKLGTCTASPGTGLRRTMQCPEGTSSVRAIVQDPVTGAIGSVTMPLTDPLSPAAP